MPSLFTPLRIGALALKNRIVMAPLTRTRASGAGRVPNALMRDYYVQRASAGMILSEATSVMPMGVGYPRTPGIWSEEQVEGWKDITGAVHAAGGLILLQLWHVGRISSPDHLGGRTPVAPSAIAAPGRVMLLRPPQPYVQPRALALPEIREVVEAFRQGAQNARRAGFDGVQIHGANGYLLEQFLVSSTNRRDDAYGGPVENRARLLLEVTDAAIGVWGADRVGVHLSPLADLYDMQDPDLPATFGHVAEALGRRKIAFVAARESGQGRLGPQLKKAFGGVFIANENLDRDSGQGLLDAGEADAIAYGQLFISNPDLPARFAADAALNTWDEATFYTDGPAGYTDYPGLGRKGPAS